ncbi:uncharacterized protein PRCAT00003941001 [Priceomyces carsonii]|uniref:uncharacterized protein n=1 Tax=Priceomyces carsonii TaxID=28549 RepID=UPI002ED82B10|nr:unnamed protein product [Priceomyces carsonii]
MSFYSYKTYIEEGDLVLIYLGRSSLKPIIVKTGDRLNTRYGHYDHINMIGKKYGEQMAGDSGYGFIYLLHPTPEMWTLSLPHRTQIVYSKDSSYILQRLNVTSGTRVLEAGTGSASFTHSFARTVGLDGKVFTYEFHEPRFLEAKKELEEHGLTKNTIITHRDVCNDGFHIESIPEYFQKEGKINADVVFLDLPSPWTAITQLSSVISQTTAVGICCFSPCIEQVDKTVKSLQDEGWINIEMVEVSSKRWEARREMVRDVGDVVKRLKDVQARKSAGIESRRVASLQAGDKRSQDSDGDDKPGPTKIQNQGKGFNPFGKGMRIREGDRQFKWKQVTKIETDIKSHTSYLTFALKLPEKRLYNS